MKSTSSKMDLKSTVRSKDSGKPTVNTQKTKQGEQSKNQTKIHLLELDVSKYNIVNSPQDEIQQLKQNLVSGEVKENENKNDNINELNQLSLDNLKNMRIFNYEKVNTYWKNQSHSGQGGKFIDQVFPPITESILDKKIKTTGVDMINIHQIDWKKASEIFDPNTLCIFPGQIEQNENILQNINFEINYNENKGALFSNYTHFFHAMNILITYPNIIEQIFKTKKVNKEGCYELYLYTKGEYKIVILDDYFPVVKGTTSLRFAKPMKSELWLMLMEKAFAKVNGGYASLLSCDVASVILCFTGFCCERLNYYDVDLEDLENSIRLNKESNLIFCEPSDIGKEKGLIKGKAYQLKELYDIKTKDDEGKEKDLKIVKILNFFEYDKYKGDWEINSPLWNEDIKRVINFKEDEKNVIYMSLENLHSYFIKSDISHIIFNANSKIIKIQNTEDEQDKLQTPQSFNLYLPSPAKVAISLVVKSKSLDIETTEYDQDLTKYSELVPSSLCIARYDPENKQFSNFEGTFNSNCNCEFARELDSGYYVIWSYISFENSKDPKPDEYYIKVSSPVNFKLRLQKADYKFHLIKEMVMSGIKQYQGPHMKETEIYTMNDSFYNYSGLGLKVIVNPFEDCYQKWTFQPDMDNMFPLYPYTNIEQFEVEVKPKGHCLILAMKIDHSKKCTFGLKSYFKTFKYISETEIEKKKNAFNFGEFCSKEVEGEGTPENYYDFVNDEDKDREKENSPENKGESQLIKGNIMNLDNKEQSVNMENKDKSISIENKENTNAENQKDKSLAQTKSVVNGSKIGK